MAPPTILERTTSCGRSSGSEGVDTREFKSNLLVIGRSAGYRLIRHGDRLCTPIRVSTSPRDLGGAAALRVMDARRWPYLPASSRRCLARFGSHDLAVIRRLSARRA